MSFRGLDGRRGQALSELALVSAVLILILLGVVDLARIYQFQTALQEAAREGARTGVIYDGSTNSNPYFCDVTAVGCPAAGFLGGAIKDKVDTVLKGAGLPASVLKPGCTGATAPYEDYTAKYPPAGTKDVPWLYICYNASTTASAEDGPGTGAFQSTPPSCGGTCGGFDMNVVVLMNFGLIVGTGPFGPSLPVSGHAHMRVQGS